MCITVLLGDLGPAQAGLDLKLHTLVISPDLALDDRVFAARWMLVSAGTSQPGDKAETAVCVCGVPLDLDMPATIALDPAEPAWPREAAFRADLSLPLPA